MKRYCQIIDGWFIEGDLIRLDDDPIAKEEYHLLSDNNVDMTYSKTVILKDVVVSKREKDSYSSKFDYGFIVNGVFKGLKAEKVATNVKSYIQ